jgi:hypothetical protein
MPVIETHPTSDTGLLPEERIAVQVVTARDAEEALRRGHHTHVMAQPAAPPARRRTRRGKPGGGTRKQASKAGKKGGRRVAELVEEGHKYEEEHGRGPAKTGRRTKTAAKRRSTKTAVKRQSPKAAAKRAAPAAKARRAKAPSKRK